MGSTALFCANPLLAGHIRYLKCDFDNFLVSFMSFSAHYSVFPQLIQKRNISYLLKKKKKPKMKRKTFLHFVEHLSALYYIYFELNNLFA